MNFFSHAFRILLIRSFQGVKRLNVNCNRIAISQNEKKENKIKRFEKKKKYMKKSSNRQRDSQKERDRIMN